MNRYDKLEARGLIAWVTNEEEVNRLVNEGKATFHVGFNLTVDSLHVGHFMTLYLMERLQDMGNKPIALVGGDTNMIEDPSGRTDMRSMMMVDQIDKSCKSFKRQMSRSTESGEGKARVVNNTDRLRNLNYIEFIRDIGSHFSVNNMLHTERYKNRMEKGLSFLEFNCMLMQTFDFYELFQCYGCNMQFGGDDWRSNMLAGTELIHRKLGGDAYAMTITLPLNSKGKKTGRIVGGAVWLNPNKTSPFVSYQYWRNVGDQDILKCLCMLTFLSLLQISEMDCWEGAKLNEVKDTFAYELTTLAHGEEEAEEAHEDTQTLFVGGGASAHVSTAELTDEDLSEGRADILTLSMKSGLVASRSEARHGVRQGGVNPNGESVKNIAASHDTDFSVGKGELLKRSKKNFVKLVKV